MAESITKAFKRASGLADFLEKRLNLQLRARRRIFGPKWKPVKRFLYYAMPNGKAASVAGFNPNNETLKNLEHDDVMCQFGPDDRWRCWAVRNNQPQYVIVWIFYYCIVWDAATNKMATGVTLNAAQGGGPATFPCRYDYIGEWLASKTEAEVTENIWNVADYGLSSGGNFGWDGSDSDSNEYSSSSCVADYEIGATPPNELLKWQCDGNASYGNRTFNGRNLVSYHRGAVTNHIPPLVFPASNYTSYRLVPRSGVGPALWRAAINEESLFYQMEVISPAPNIGTRTTDSRASGSFDLVRPLLTSQNANVSFSWYTLEEKTDPSGPVTYSYGLPSDQAAFLCDLFSGVRSMDTGLHVVVDILGVAYDSYTWEDPTGYPWDVGYNGLENLNYSIIGGGDVSPSVAAICKLGDTEGAPPTELNPRFTTAITNLLSTAIGSGLATWNVSYGSAPYFYSSMIKIYIRKPKPPEES